MLSVARTILILIAMMSQPAAYAVSQAPDLRLATSDGEIALSSLKGKVVYLDFWASWCKPCLKSFPWMKRMKQNYADQGFEILAVNVDAERSAADEFLSARDVNFIVAFDQDGEAASAYELRGMPSTYLVGRDGKIYATHIGFREQDKQVMESALKKLLQQ